MTAMPVQEGSFLTVYFGLSLLFAVLAILSWRFDRQIPYEKRAMRLARVFLALQAVWFVFFFLTMRYSGETRIWPTISDALIFLSYTMTIPMFYAMSGSETPLRSWWMVVLALFIAVPVTVFIPAYANKLHAGNIAALILVTENARALWHYVKRSTDDVAARTLLYMVFVFVGLLLARSAFLLMDPAWAEWNESFISFLLPLMSLTVTVLVLASITLKAHRDLAKMALRDSLTGLHNRHALFRDYSAMASRATRQGKTFALLVCDLDHFKTVNDRYGHAQGDAVLVAFADILRHILRDSDVAARIGGEEFVLLIDETDAAGLDAICQRILTEIRQMTFDNIDPDFSLTTSIGATLVTDHGMAFDAAFKNADQCLYTAKNKGRDQAIIYGEG